MVMLNNSVSDGKVSMDIISNNLLNEESIRKERSTYFYSEANVVERHGRSETHGRNRSRGRSKCKFICRSQSLKNDIRDMNASPNSATSNKRRYIL
ncbi:hypothetical protein Lal_00018681 [Lupinus albus]|nr:hypothetical protein Lal_00018681 [Lupinus albus]